VIDIIIAIILLIVVIHYPIVGAWIVGGLIILFLIEKIGAILGRLL
jgi:hypothetical protein